jgi:uncharacterized protein (DUF1697 family)
VGGRSRFRPAVFARELAAFDVLNIGAAGTFVVRKPVSQATLRAELLRKLPVKAEFMICPARDIVDLVSADPFPPEASAEGVRRFVSVLAKRPTKLPKFPLTHPDGKSWQVKVVGLHGKCALSLWRRMGKTLAYPNEVVEKSLGISATTRNWDTITKIHDVLQRRA